MNDTTGLSVRLNSSLANSSSNSSSIPSTTQGSSISWETLFVGLLAVVVALFVAYQPLHLRWLADEHRLRLLDPDCSEVEKVDIKKFLDINYEWMKRGWFAWFCWSLRQALGSILLLFWSILYRIKQYAQQSWRLFRRND
jgi:hypothetical protein